MAAFYLDLIYITPNIAIWNME